MKVKIRKNLIKYCSISILLLGVLSIGAVYAYSIATGGYRAVVNVEETVDKWTVCKKVTNNNTNDIFIPTGSAAEWQAFRDNATDVTFAECCTAGLCKECPGPTVPSDDSSCGTIDCDGLNSYYTYGSASVTSTNYCKYKNYADITSNRCEGLSNCKDANTSDCTSYSTQTVATCGTCKYASGACSSCSNYSSGTSCGTNMECNSSGNCVSSSGTECSWTGWSSPTCPPQIYNCPSGERPVPWGYIWVTIRECVNGYIVDTDPVSAWCGGYECEDIPW